MTQLVDDRLLATLLAGGDPPRPQEPVHTTGYWYVRLCRAVLGSAGPSGVLSASFAALPPATRTQALQALLELPEGIRLESLRTLAPLIGHLHQRHRLNALLGSKKRCAQSAATSKSSHRPEPNPTPTADPGLVPLAQHIQDVRVH